MCTYAPFTLISKRELAHFESAKSSLQPSLSAQFIISVKNTASQAERVPHPPIINPCLVCSSDSMLEIWTGLQLLTASLASIQEQLSTPFFISYQEEEILNALDFSPPDGKSCLWASADVDVFLQSGSQTETLEPRNPRCQRGDQQQQQQQHLAAAKKKNVFLMVVCRCCCCCWMKWSCNCYWNLPPPPPTPNFPLTYQNSGKPCRNSMRGFPLSPAAT